MSNRGAALKPAALKTVPRSSSLRWLAIAEIQVDPEAQRALSKPWVEQHVNDFDPEQIGYIVVNRRENGKLYVVDGQHRLALLAAVGWGDQQVQCEYFEGLTQAGEAELFLARNDRKSVQTFDKFRVSITAKEEMACDIDRIVRIQGLAVANQQKEGHIVAVAALTRVYSGDGISVKDGPAALARTLKIIQNAWGRRAANFNGKIIEGIGAMQLRYDGAIDQEALAAKLAPFSGGASGVLGRAKSLHETRGHPLHHCVASTLVDIYNKGRRVGKLEDWWA